MSTTTSLTGTSSSSSGVNLALSGLASGMDWQTLVSELADAERAPETQWKTTQSTILQTNSDFTTISGDLSTLQTAVDTLKDPTLYQNATAQSSDSTIATASAASGASAGTYTFTFGQPATAAKITGSGNIAQVLSPTDDPSSVTIGTAGLATPISAGTFTVDGQQITVATTDSLQQVFDNIAAATNNNVTASYSSTTDKITLTSADNSPIVLGSAADTSNFLQATKLYNTGGSTVSSSATLGSVRLGTDMTGADLATAVTGDSNGNGEFTINGVAINYNVNSDSIQDVLNNINNSAAGVTASYNPLTDSFSLANKSTGDVGISVKDVTGNFLQATGLTSGAGAQFVQGTNLNYTINNGPQLVSQSNDITSDSSEITGLTVSAQKAGTATVTVASDTSQIQTAIQSFITAYNSVQSFISAQAATTTDSSGNVTAGLLTGDPTAAAIADSLRSLSFSNTPPAGQSSSIQGLADLGIQTNGQDNTISLSDPTALTNALTNNLSSVESLFTDATNGIATQLDSYLNDTIGTNGTLTAHQTTLTNESSSIDTQIANLEQTVTANEAQWTSEFEAMEQAEAQTNQELTYLSQAVTNNTL